MKKNNILYLIIAFLSFSLKAQTIQVELKQKVRVKTVLDYEKVLAFNPDIANYDIIAGDLIYDNVKIRLGIWNENRNKKYNEIGSDFLIAGNYQDNSLSIEENISCVKIRDTNILQVKDKFFLIKYISEDGSKIVLNPTSNSLKATIKYIDELPNDSFTDFNGKKFNFTDFKRQEKYIYIHFWASWCSLCIPKLPYINLLQEKYSSKLIIVGFNGDNEDSAFKESMKKYKINWSQFKPNPLLSENLKHVGYPYSILADENGKIIKWHPSIEDVINVLEKKN
jgi:thiol-disulfide isomerase/thioredoxin